MFLDFKDQFYSKTDCLVKRDKTMDPQYSYADAIQTTEDKCFQIPHTNLALVNSEPNFYVTRMVLVGGVVQYDDELGARTAAQMREQMDGVRDFVKLNHEDRNPQEPFYPPLPIGTMLFISTGRSITTTGHN